MRPYVMSKTESEEWALNAKLKKPELFFYRFEFCRDLIQSFALALGKTAIIDHNGAGVER